MSNLHSSTHVEGNVLYVKETEIAGRRTAVAKRLKELGLTKACSMPNIIEPVYMSIDKTFIDSVVLSGASFTTMTASEVHEGWAIGDISLKLKREADYIIVTSRGENVAIYWRE